MNKIVCTFDPHQNSSESVEILQNESINLQENHLEIMFFAQWGGGVGLSYYVTNGKVYLLLIAWG